MERREDFPDPELCARKVLFRNGGAGGWRGVLRSSSEGLELGSFGVRGGGGFGVAGSEKGFVVAMLSVELREGRTVEGGEKSDSSAKR